MNTTKYIRLTSMTIDNIKNIEHGRINFINTRKDYKSSLLGIYGQNGSGKTALIDVICTHFPGHILFTSLNTWMLPCILQGASILFFSESFYYCNS